MTQRKPYPTDVSDEEWAFAAPYLTLMVEQAPQRKYEVHSMFNALRWMAEPGRSEPGRSQEGRSQDTHYLPFSPSPHALCGNQPEARPVSLSP